MSARAPAQYIGGPPPNTTMGARPRPSVTRSVPPAPLRRLVRVAAGAALLALATACRRTEAAGARYKGPYAEQVNAAIPKIEEGVGLPFKRMPVIEERSREEVRAFIEKEFAEGGVARDLQGQSVAYKLLGALPDTLDYKRFISALLVEQIAGYYDPASDKLYVVRGAPEVMTSITVQHELVHALQDQYLNLDSLKHIQGDNDAALAVAAFTEGQATYEQLRIMQPNADMSGLWDRAREGVRQAKESLPLMAAAPAFIRESLIFPYFGGAEFVRQLKLREPNESPFAELPHSSEQVLHPDAFFAKPPDAPTRIGLPARIGRAKIYENDLGEFETRLWLYTLLGDQGAALRGAAGWDGDRYAVIDTPGGDGIVWVTVWDSPLEAAEFLDLARQAAVKRHGGRAATDGSVTAGGRTVTVAPGEITGRPVVVWTDVPQGTSADVLDLRQVTLAPR